MRRRSLATSFVALIAGLAARAAVRRFAARRAATVAVAAPVVAGPAVLARPAVPAPARQAVVLPFVPRVLPAAPEKPAAPARCGDSGGRTKAGAPCGARAGAGGRCHHHRLAA